VADKKYGVVSPEVLKSYDGLGFLKAIVDGTLPHPPISEVLGFNLIDVAHGRAVFEGLPEYRHYNPIGTVHGGFAATLLDSALGCARSFRRSSRATPGPHWSLNSIWCGR